MPFPILFPLNLSSRNRNPMLLGVGPNLSEAIPPPATMFRITGVTRDSAGAALAGCTVKLYRTISDVLVDTVVSDGAGAYAFTTGAPATNFYIVAYKAGSPDVEGTTANTLTAVG